MHVTFHGRVTTDTTTPPIPRSRVHWNANEQNRFVESVLTNVEEHYLKLSQLLDLNNANDSPKYGNNNNRVFNRIGIFFSKSAIDTFGKSKTDENRQ